MFAWLKLYDSNVLYNSNVASLFDPHARADGIADFQGDPIMGNPASHRDPAYYGRDGIHPVGGE